MWGGEEFAQVHRAGVGDGQAQVEVVGGIGEGFQEGRLGQVDPDGPVLDVVVAGEVPAEIVEDGQSSGGQDEIDAVGGQLGGEGAAYAG